MDSPLSIDAVRSALRTHTIGRHIEAYAEIDSTNSRAVSLGRAGAPDGTLVLAELQTQGRGRLDRRWEAPAASSLLMSLLLRPRLLPRQAQRLTMICSLAAVEGIRSVTGLEARLKWPNDVYLHERKLGGILTELGLDGSTLAYAVVGMGLNVNLDVEGLRDVMTPAISLSAALGHPVARLDLLVAILQAAERRYEWLRAGWSPADEWQRCLLNLGRQVTVSSAEGTLTGLAEGVDEDGALLVRTMDGSLKTVLAADVTVRGPQSDAR